MSGQNQNLLQFMMSSEKQEWITPEYIITAARHTMEGIDLDPASSFQANQFVRANRYYSYDEGANGLLLPWWGHVWLNPPFGRGGNVTRWISRLEAYYELGEVKQACLLVKAAFGYNWFMDLWHRYPLCIFNERPKFIDPDTGTEAKDRIKHGVAVVYFGPNTERFEKRFQAFGYIKTPGETTPARLWA